MKCRKPVIVLTSAEGGQTIMIEICFNAAGRYMPSMFILLRVKINQELLCDCILESWAECHLSSWMQDDIYFLWFITWSGATNEKKVWFLLDGYITHTKNIELIDYARNNGVVLLYFSPHYTHWFQHLDIASIRPLSTFYDSEISIRLSTNPGRLATVFQIA